MNLLNKFFNKAPQEESVPEKEKINKINNGDIEKTSPQSEIVQETDSEKFPEKITMEDIPTYMTGDAEGFSTFKQQVDKGAEKILYYYAKDNRQLFDERNDDSDAEIIIKKEESYGKPIPEEDKKQLFDVLCLYLRAYGKRGRSVTTIGIRIPKGVDPVPFMKKLAQEVYEANTNIDALYFKDFDLSTSGWDEFHRRQAKLKSFAKEKFLKYANEQIADKKSKK